MIDLPNLDTLDGIELGMSPPPEPTKPSDTETRARCLIDIPGMMTADYQAPRSRVLSSENRPDGAEGTTGGCN